MITVYGYPRSRSRRATWALEEVGQPYQWVMIDFKKGEHQAPEFLEINPSGKVPALKHDELVLTESMAIVHYIGETFGGGLIPSDRGARALYLQWSAFAISELEQGLWNISKHKFILPREKRIPEMRAIGSWEFQKSLKLLSKGLQDRPYIVGDQFTGADILLGQSLYWASRFEQPCDYENLNQYLDRLLKRPAWIKSEDTEGL